YNPKGTPLPERDPVIIISVASNSGHTEIIEASEGSKGDVSLLARFSELVRRMDPDIIVGYNSNGFDWQYLMKRAEVLKINLDVGRVKDGVPRTSVYGHISIQGRANVDLYDFAQELYEVKIKSLEEVADYLGVMRKSERTLIPWYEIHRYWDDPGKREILRKYAKDDVVSTLGLADRFVPFAIQLSSLTGLPLDQVGAASVGFRLEWFLIRSARKFRELVPNRVERPYTSYRGAIVLKPVKGVHENIAVLDFSSMYPSLMIKYNIGPDTFVNEECSEDECFIIPDLNYKFRKEPPGFYKNVLTTLLKLRNEVKEEMRKYPPNSPEYRLLNERQKALKVLANASYGYMGWMGARWYFKEGAEAVTALGRATISKAIKIAEHLGLRVIYGDTDSLFVVNDEEKVDKFIKKVEEELGLEIKVDKVYRKVFFTEAKKRYIGLLPDGRIDIVGFEAVRGDWTEIAKEVQEEVGRIVLKTGSPDEAVTYVRNVVENLRKGRVPLDKLIIWKKITKRVEEYDVSAPHVEAARRMMKAGIKVEPGMEIGYVIVKGSGSISSRAMPYMMATVEDVDHEYYVKHQIIPAALRILSYFGITEKHLEAAGKVKKTLADFFVKKK
ncbi:MAG: ribonuclease H-like domain-containing protein, partial [Desulfurococcales archaeon]|nr:ribonuclease H-like domain-containing protein [Desulfurococcales archaeon]